MKINLNNGYITKKNIQIENSNIILYSIVNTDKFDNKINEYEVSNNCKSILHMNCLTADYISEILFDKSFYLSKNLISTYCGRQILIDDDLEYMEVEIMNEL